MAGQVSESLLDEAHRLLEMADDAGITMRLIGGMGIRLLLGELLDARFSREIADLDLLTSRRAARDVEHLLEEAGWQPERRFNALNGARRLLFADEASRHKIDVFVESFEMCHALPLAERLTVRDATLPAADLAMTKLQIVSLNGKDSADLYALFHALPVAEHDDGAINIARICDLTKSDWGLHHTFELNLERLLAGLGETSLDAQERKSVAERITTVTAALESVPKSRGWKLRARVGERRLWYDEPEEIER